MKDSQKLRILAEKETKIRARVLIGIADRLERTVTDEEIEREIMMRMANFKLTENPFHGLSAAFEEGAKWMRDKLTK